MKCFENSLNLLPRQLLNAIINESVNLHISKELRAPSQLEFKAAH